MGTIACLPSFIALTADCMTVLLCLTERVSFTFVSIPCSLTLSIHNSFCLFFSLSLSPPCLLCCVLCFSLHSCCLSVSLPRLSSIPTPPTPSQDWWVHLNPIHNQYLTNWFRFLALGSR